ncbi:unnamed protein product [Brassicogethes aeneus]|uniref:Uncharacterized protein n=1 Tax=Brassicogethes aeneus TaxID=1431903 RepID=A0A9P0B221_BRAAE|nr:unnamed protein product [Brassicogethes aeneus]
MSPASSGNLEIERYIGACLISQNRSKSNNNHGGANKGREFYARDPLIPDIFPANYVNLDGRYRLQRCNSVDVWAGGMPLISFANNQRQRSRHLEPQDGLSGSQRVDDQHSPLARLAVHTQGAPLILTKSYNHRKNKVNRNNNNNGGQKNPPSQKLINHNKCQDVQNNGTGGVDAVSVASDESSGSANSENCLPRIIKPRKRRKKDRKPPLLGRPLSQEGFSTDSASPDIDTSSVNLHRSFIPFNFDNNNYSFRSVTVPDNIALSHMINNNNSFVDRYQNLHDTSETPNLHHSFEDIEEVDDGKDINGNQTTSTCQCRYCDPSGQIWDVDRSCYSPFLTPPNNHNNAFQFNFNLGQHNYYTNPIKDEENYCLVHSMSSVSLEEDNNKSVQDKKVKHITSGDLEVSTEIVTSLNGHRDLEIKFFSTHSADVSPNHHHNINTDKFAVNSLMCKFVSEE